MVERMRDSGERIRVTTDGWARQATSNRPLNLVAAARGDFDLRTAGDARRLE